MKKNGPVREINPQGQGRDDRDRRKRTELAHEKEMIVEPT